MESAPKRPVPRPRTRRNLPVNKVNSQPLDGNRMSVRQIVIKMEEEMLRFDASFNPARMDKNSKRSDASTQTISEYSTIKEVDLFLIGKTGTGKSALGNSILRRNAFESGSSLSCLTDKITFDVCEFPEFKIKVVDGPGVGDIDKDEEQATKDTLNTISEAISINPHGYHAFLLVLKYGDRITAEDKKTIEFLKKIFGEHFFKKYCIIVMTCGDKFYDESEMTFESWVAKQSKKVFIDFLKECNNRIVLFDNKTKDELRKDAQMTALLQLVEKLKTENCRYATEHFHSSQFSRDTLSVEAEKDRIESEAVTETNLIYQSFKILLDRCQSEKEAIHLTDLKERAQTLLDKIKKQDKSTGVLHQSLTIISSLISTISDEIKFCKKIAEEREKAMLIIHEKSFEYTKNLQQQREEFEKYYAEGKIKEEERNKMFEDHLRNMTEQQDRCRKEIKELEDRHRNELKSQTDLHDLRDSIKELRDAFVQKMEKKRKKGILKRMFHLSSKKD